MATFFRCVASPAGRGSRNVVGLAWIQGGGSRVLAIADLVALLAGALDKCVLAPLFGLRVTGPRLRRALKEKPQT